MDRGELRLIKYRRVLSIQFIHFVYLNAVDRANSQSVKVYLFLSFSLSLDGEKMVKYARKISYLLPIILIRSY